MRNLLLFTSIGYLAMAGAAMADKPSAPRIDYVEPAADQPQESDPSVIWYDDFDDDKTQEQYAEKGGETTEEMPLGSDGRSLPMHYARGHRGKGGRKLFFGDTPIYRNRAVRRGEVFKEVYWRIYVKHQAGWKGGGPAKLSRATSFATDKWAQAMIAHVWSSGESLTLDPATGIRGSRLVTSGYNDFENLKWLGNKPASDFKIHATDEAGRWVCVEARVKLNTPGEKDGENQLWIDGKLETERTGLNWRGSYTKTSINAVFLEAYWNNGSPVDQSRWIDNFVVSTNPIGPVVSKADPTIVKTPYDGPGAQQAWQVEIAKGKAGAAVVWRSGLIEGGNSVSLSDSSGSFVGTSKAMKRLEADTVHVLRVRQQSDVGSIWSDWSDWHQPFRTPE